MGHSVSTAKPARLPRMKRSYARSGILGLVCVLATFTASPAAAQAARSAREEGLAATVQRFVDKEEIQVVLLDYGRFLDSRDFTGYSSLFAADGEWAGGFGT